jgi:putative transposase
MTLGKVPKNRGLFPLGEASFKLPHLAPGMGERWAMPIANWNATLNKFAILLDGRVPRGGVCTKSNLGPN